MISDQNVWFAVDVTVRIGAVEPVEFAFNSMETLGTEINHLQKKSAEAITVVGYFATAPVFEDTRKIIVDTLRAFGFEYTDLINISEREVENTDWLAEWKKYWKPTTVGKFIIAPPWETVAETGKIVIRIEPNMAFGTGTHETTQLCLDAIGKLYDPKQSFMDVGTGTGILSIAVAKLGGSGIFACDTDRDSIKIAKENALANCVGDLIEFRDGPIGDDTPIFDFVCANLTIDVIVPILPLLIARSQTLLLLSGILAEQEGLIVKELIRLENPNYRIERSGEWISVTIKIN